MDITDFQIAEEPKALSVIHPVTKEKTDITVFCISPDHPDYKDRALAAVRAGLDPNARVDAARVVDKRPEVIAAMITGWEGISIGGKAFKYTKTNAVKLMKEYPWIQAQVDKFCGERENFFKGSGKA